MRTRVPDISDVATALPARHLLDIAHQQQLGKADDGVERSAQLMAHGGKERDLASLAISALRCASSSSTARRWARSTVFSSSAFMVPMPR